MERIYKDISWNKKTFRPDYRVSFDWEAIGANGTVHFIIHKPIDDAKQKATFPKVHSVAAAHINVDDRGRTTVKDTTPWKKRKKRIDRQAK